MAYRAMDTDPTQQDQSNFYGAGDPAFPPLEPIDPSAPVSANDALTTWPYKGRAGKICGPRILMRPPQMAAPSSDPVLSGIESLQDQLSQLNQSMRSLSAPYLVMPPDGESFTQFGGIPIPATDGAFHVVLTTTVPAGRNGSLNRIANVYIGGGFTDYSGSIIWQIVRNPGTGITAAERNYENITASLGSAAAPGRIAPIRMFETDIFELVVKNVSVVPAGQTIGGLLGGWYYPKTWDDQFDRQSNAVSL